MYIKLLWAARITFCRLIFHWMAFKTGTKAITLGFFMAVEILTLDAARRALYRLIRMPCGPWVDRNVLANSDRAVIIRSPAKKRQPTTLVGLKKSPQGWRRD